MTYGQYKDCDEHENNHFIGGCISYGTTTTRHLIPTRNLPILKPLRDTELTLTRQTRISDALNAALKPAVDAGYSRNDAKDTDAKPAKTVSGKDSDTGTAKKDSDAKGDSKSESDAS